MCSGKCREILYENKNKTNIYVKQLKVTTMRKMKLFFTALAVLITSVAFAQNLTVTGNVTDAATGEPVPFASVHEKGTMNGTNTDVNGHYSITVSQNAVLVFSSIGYNTVEVAVNGSAQVNCELPVDTETLDNAVVVGYGSAKKASSLVGSVQTVNSQTLKNAPSSSALDQLQGQVAGLQVLTHSGVAGDNNVSMTLHGTGSLGSSSTPLYVIDGIPSSSRSIMAMNPNDIESVSVLKDASATSIYGSRAANGVIYITTKAGSYNEKAFVTARAQYGVSTLANMSLYENMMTGDELKNFWVRSGLQTAESIKANYTDKGYNHNTRWYEYMMNIFTPQYQSDFTIQGGGRKVAYMVSASQFHQEGFTPGNYYDRYTVRTNVQGNPLNWLKFGANVNLSLDENTKNGNWGSSSGNAAYTFGGLSYLLNPLYPAIDPETGEVFPESFTALGLPNPDFWFSNLGTIANTYGLNGSAFLQIEPVRNLRFMSRAGVDGIIQISQGTASPVLTPLFGVTPWASKSTGFQYQATITNTLEYILDINHNHKFTFLVGQEGVSNDYMAYSAYSEGQTDPRMLLLQQGKQDTYDVSESHSQSKFLSFFGHIDYTLMDKYYFDVVLRNDAVSRFGADMRNAQFWSAGARWNVKNEGFLRDVRAVNKLDFKVSYGTQGNANIGDYSSLGIIGTTSPYQQTTGTGLAQPANPKLTWENQALLTVALSGRVWDTLDFNFEYYNRLTTSMLMSVPNPYTTGFSEIMQNVGTLQNQGIDITLGVDILRGRDYFLKFNTTFNFNNEKILELFDGRDRWQIPNTGIAYVVGKPVSYYYPIYAGVDPEDGLPMWYKPGENIDEMTMNETTKTFDETTLEQNTGKRRHAPINGGFTFSGAWRGLSFQADFAYVIGKYMINNDAFFYANPAMNNTDNQFKGVTDYWTPDNTDAQWPAWNKGVNMEFDTHLLEDASFLRLKNLQVAYALPQGAIKWTNGVIKEFKITFTGRNLLTATKYTGLDPEPNTNVAAGIAGNSKQILGGIEITF